MGPSAASPRALSYPFRVGRDGVCFAIHPSFEPEKSSERHHDRRGPDFRHDFARRRAGIASQLVGGTENPHRASACPAQGRRHRGRFSHFLARRLHFRRDHRQGSRRPHRLRPGPRGGKGHSRLRQSGASGPAAAHSHLPWDLDHPSRKKAPPLAGRDPGHGREQRETGASQVRRCAVLGRGRRPHRTRLLVQGSRNRHQERRPHRQHPRHRRLHDARDLRVDHRRHHESRAQRRPSRHRGPLSQRPGLGHGEFHHRRQARRAPGGMHHQRHRRARRQRGPRRGRDDHEGAARLPRRFVRPRHHGNHAHEQAGARRVRDAGAGQQGGGGRQRLCPLVRHPPRRRAQVQVDLRNHDPAVHRPQRQQDEPDQPVGQPHGEESPRSPGLRREEHRSSRPFIPSSSPWPTRRARSTTTTSWP